MEERSVADNRGRHGWQSGEAAEGGWVGLKTSQCEPPSNSKCEKRRR